MVNFAEKFKLSPKFFLISRKVTFFCGCGHYFMGKKLRNCLFFNLGAICSIRPKNSKKQGQKLLLRKFIPPLMNFRHTKILISYIILVCSECVISFLPYFQAGVLR